MATCNPKAITPVETSNSYKLESEHVTSVYSSIAPHFSMTRYKPWPRVESFIQSLPPNSLVADIGCGNGKYLRVKTSGIILGCDNCVNLLTLAKSSSSFLLQADTTNLPYVSNAFDAVISIAVIHHLSSEERRVVAIKEMMRVLRPGGRILVYVWAKEQEKRDFVTQDVLVPWVMRKNVIAEGNKKIKKKGKGRKVKEKRKSSECVEIVYETGLDSLFEDEGNLSSGEIENNSVSDLKEVSEIEVKNSLEKMNSIGEEVQNIVQEKANMRDDFDIYMRYYHVFREGELKELFEKFVSNARVLDCYYDHENWCVVAEKLSDKS